MSIDTTGILLAQFTRGDDIRTLVHSEFFAFMLPFLLTFAVVYGLLEMGKIPKEKNPRVVISLASAFLVLPVAPSLVGVLSTISSGLLIAVGGLLMLVVLFEMVGIKGTVKKDQQDIPVSLFVAHNKIVLFVIGIALLLVLANAGVFSTLGIPVPELVFNSPLIFFLIIMIALVAWTSSHKEK